MGAIQQSVNQLTGTIARASIYKQGIKAIGKTGKQTAALTNTINTLANDYKFNNPGPIKITAYRDPEVANRIARAEASMAKAIKPINIYKENLDGKH